MVADLEVQAGQQMVESEVHMPVAARYVRRSRHHRVGYPLDLARGIFRAALERHGESHRRSAHARLCFRGDGEVVAAVGIVGKKTV